VEGEISLTFNYTVDELHYFNGLLGSHVAFIMRRLRRICAALGNRHVKFISCSATVANPEEHFRAIFGVEDVRLVNFDGSPSGMCIAITYTV
jgi:DEAD/DEAH box helicase domain-containing protein